MTKMVLRLAIFLGTISLKKSTVKQAKVTPVTTEEYGAVRPFNSRLDKSKLEKKALSHFQLGRTLLADT